MGQHATDELGACHPPTFSHDGTKLGDVSTVDSNRDDLTGIDALEQRTCMRSKFLTVDRRHASRLARVRSTSHINSTAVAGSLFAQILLAL
jgi:hypothetical protein